MAVSPVGWDDDPMVAAWPGLPRLDGDCSTDACVVGLGGTGLAAVEALSDRGLSVIGVDAGRVAAGAAGRNGGLLLGGADAYLHDSIAALGLDDALWLYRATLAELDHLADLLPDVVRRCGSIRLAGLPGEPVDDDEADDRAAELADCAAHEAVLRGHGIAVGRYDGPLGSGLFLPDDAAMNPARRALGLARLLSARARLFERTRVIGVDTGAVITDRGTVSAAIVVVCLDGRLEILLPQLAGRVRTARLQMLACSSAPVGRLPCPVYGRWGYDYAQQLPGSQIFLGGGRDLFGADEWTDSGEPSQSVQRYLDALAVRMAGGPVTVTHRWAASVGFTPDPAGRPVCAEVAESVMACGGYNGTGNLVGPVAARAAVAALVDGVAVRSCFDSRPTG